LTAPFARQYAESVGAEYVQERTADAPIHGAFAKLALDRWAAQADQTLWIDADVLCLPSAPDIFKAAPLDTILAFTSEGSLHQKNKKCPWPMFKHGYANTGVMVWPKCAAGLVQQAAGIMERGEIDHIDRRVWFFEQTALNLAIERSGIKIKDLDYRWNCYIAEEERQRAWPNNPLLRHPDDCWFIHFAGGAHTPQGCPQLVGDRHSQTERAEWMRQYMVARGLI
jgi:lipopolysaccharide biosynthesis glycosyltransferase